MTTEAKAVPYRIENLKCWDGSFLAFCRENEKAGNLLMVYEIEPPGLGQPRIQVQAL